MSSQYHGKRRSYHFRTFEMNGDFVCHLWVDNIKGWFTAAGETREKALENAMLQAGKFIEK